MAERPDATPARLRQDQRVERVIGALLQTGVLLSIAVALIGLALYLDQSGRRMADFRVFRGEPVDLRSARATVTAALAGGREAIIQLGVLILIATPIARVLLSLVAFALQRDKTYILVTLIVLVVLLAGLIGVAP